MRKGTKRVVLSVVMMTLVAMTAAAQQSYSSTTKTVPTKAAVPPAKAAYAPLEVAFSYSYARANAGPGQCGCFNMNGGNTEVAFHAYRGLSAVVDLTGERAGTVGTAGDGLSLVAVTAGPRFSYHFAGDGLSKLSRYTPFVQGLVGSAHGFDALFPNKATGTATGAANGFAMLAGGGLDVTVNKYIAIRAVQADYMLTHLPNNASDQQHILRISAGIVLRAW
ncbi:MAG: hypothetical protein ACYC46_01765 [Acidobacteriaceae bacterium]